MNVLKLKNSVRFYNINYPALTVFRAVLDLWKELVPAINPVLTSANDSRHTTNSKHYSDLGWDFRTNNLPRATAELATQRLVEILGTNYDVILEKDHLHVEYDEK